MDLKSILTDLVRLRPEAAAAQALKRAAEQRLHQLLRGDGLRAVERLVAALNTGGHHLQLVARAAGTRTWSEEVGGGKHKLDIYVASNRSYHASSLRYADVPKAPTLTPAQQRRDALQKRFYERYMAIGQKAYKDPRARISPVDRRVLLVGELEADVNNGGFSQYLSNKGPRRARSALEALEMIGARKTAAMLQAALKPGVSEAELGRLDARFYKAPEDIAVLAARHAGL